MTQRQRHRCHRRAVTIDVLQARRNGANLRRSPLSQIPARKSGPAADDGAPAAPVMAAGGGNNFCATAFDKIICEKVTKGSANWDEAMTKALTEAMKHAESVTRKSKVANLGKSGCDKTYINIQSRLEECMDLVKKGDKDDEINFRLSMAVTGLEDCKNDLLDLKQEKTPFYVANRNFDHMLKVCLAIDKSKYEKTLKH